MRAIFSVWFLIIVTLALVAAAVFGLGDKTTLVPPPEAVVESFVRALQAERYDGAMTLLSEDLQTKVEPGTLRSLAERLRQRAGKILDAQGEAGWIDGDRAEACARLQTERGQTLFKFPLSRGKGLWSIQSLAPIE